MDTYNLNQRTQLEMTESTVLDEIVAPGKPWAGVLNKGQRLRIVDLEGRQGVDFLCYDDARAIFTIIEDTANGHDTIAGCCSTPSNAMLYGVDDCRGCRENFLSSLHDYGLGRKDIVPNINFFCSVPVAGDQTLAPTVFTDGTSKPGDYVELKANMNALAVISNCPQINNPCNGGKPTPIRILILNNDK